MNTYAVYFYDTDANETVRLFETSAGPFEALKDARIKLKALGLKLTPPFAIDVRRVANASADLQARTERLMPSFGTQGRGRPKPKFGRFYDDQKGFDVE